MKPKNVGELEVRYDGRCLKFEVLINTDEPDFAVADRLRKAAAGLGLKMAVVMGGVLDKEDGKLVWEKLLPLMKKESENQGRS